MSDQERGDYDYPEHCKECGAYLSTKVDQDTHTAWHMSLNNVITEIAHLAGWNRLYG